MADTNQLTAVSSSGDQGSTQNPQTAGASTGGGTQASDFQPTTTSSQLTSTGGVPLQATSVTTVPLAAASATASTSVASTVKVPLAAHHANAALLALPALLLLIGVAVFMSISRSAKTTTD